MIPEATNTSSDHDPEWSFSSIPDEIALNCFARVPKREYASLSVVCKSFRSLLTSPELYVNRREGNEVCFYVCLHLPNHPSPRWFSLWLKPKPFPPLSRAKGNPNSSEITLARNLLVPISASLPESKTMVAIGSEIYAIGGSTSLSTSVRVFDCGRHTWHDGPDMTVARRNAMAFGIGSKIYVMGGCSVDDEWSEVLDTKTLTWGPLENPEERNFAEQIKKNPRIFDLCQWWWVTDKVMYCYTYTGSFMWYDSVREKWIYLKGLERLLKHCNAIGSCRMVGTVSYDGNKVVLMCECPSSTGDTANKEFWCAVVAMGRRLGDNIWGRTMWIDLMLTVPKSYDLLRCLAVSV